MGAAIGGVLAIDERKEGLSVATVGVGETEFERLAGKMERRVDRFALITLQIFKHEIQEAVSLAKPCSRRV